MAMQIFGWHGLTNDRGWVHVPEETYENQYPVTHEVRVRHSLDNQIVQTDKPYIGTVHTKVDNFTTDIVVKLNGKVIMQSSAYHLKCNECGAES